MEIICKNLEAMLSYKEQNNDVQATLNELFPRLVGQDSFQKLFKIGFDNCESEERASRLMNEYLKSLEVETYNRISVII
jgi:glutathionylspermidine synthase